jgi:phosphate acyltransferase
MKIAVDAMGGDYAPKAVIDGVVMAVKECKVQIVLIGLSGLIEAELSKYEDWEKLPIEVVHAEDVVEMDEAPSKVLRSKKKSSIKVGLELVKDGYASAFVSAGNTGAVLAFATFTLRLLKGVDRPAIAIQLPTLKGYSILLDAGANVDCKASQLFQFGIMGHSFSKYIHGKLAPDVGLLSIGEEDSKGNDVTREAFQMLKNSHVKFIGNLEGKEVYQGNADVIVCDGFTGNIALKISESLAEMIGENLKQIFMANWITRVGYYLIKPHFINFKKMVDHSETGGAPLLGVNGVCIIAHGGSSPKAIKNAIIRAKELVEKKMNEHIRDDIESNLLVSKEPFWKQIKKIAFVPGKDEKNSDSSKDSDPPAEDKSL